MISQLTARVTPTDSPDIAANAIALQHQIQAIRSMHTAGMSVHELSRLFRIHPQQIKDFLSACPR